VIHGCVWGANDAIGHLWEVIWNRNWAAEASCTGRVSCGSHLVRELQTGWSLSAAAAFLSACRRTVAYPMSDLEYVYELRQGEEVVATGRLSRAQPLEVGERLSIGGRDGIVRTIEPLLGGRELRLVVQLVRDGI
jgi:hypothetical protein